MTSRFHPAVRLSPPRAGLLPDAYRRKLVRAASQAHHALNKYSFRFTLCESVWGTSEYKWIPWNAFEQFEQEYKRACETLSRAKAEVLALRVIAERLEQNEAKPQSISIGIAAA